MWGAIVLAGAVIFAAVIWIAKKNSSYSLSALGWIGGILCLVSLFAFPWVLSGGPGTVQRNAAELAQKTEMIDMIKRLPGFDQWLVGIDVLSAQDIISSLDHSLKEDFLVATEKSPIINGLDILRLVRTIKPNLSLALAASALCGLFATLISLTRMIAINGHSPSGSEKKKVDPPVVSYESVFEEMKHSAVTMPKPRKQVKFAAGGIKVIAIMSLVCTLVILDYLPTLDTFAQHNNFTLRLLAALSETRVSFGGWLMLLGLVLIMVSSFQDWVPSS